MQQSQWGMLLFRRILPLYIYIYIYASHHHTNFYWNNTFCLIITTYLVFSFTGCCGGVLRVNNLDSYSSLQVPLPMHPLEVLGRITNEPHCLSFWYYMRGNSVQTLVVTGSYRGDIGITTLWLREGDQGDHWRQGQILILNPSKLFRVRSGAICLIK